MSIKGETRIEELTPEERAVARRSAESRATVPHLELTVARSGPVSSGRLVHACAMALVEFPRANGAYRDGHFELYSRVNVGVVIATERSYLIPTLFDADRKPVDELDTEIDQLVIAVEAGTLTSPALSGATFTAWNAAGLGLAAAGIPPVPPQAGALAAGLAALTLACDHRILYGALAARFLQAIADHLDGGGV